MHPNRGGAAALRANFTHRTPRIDTPRIDTSRIDTPHIDTPHIDTSRIDTSRIDTPHIDTAHIDTPRIDTARIDTAARGGLACQEPARPDTARRPRRRKMRKLLSQITGLIGVAMVAYPMWRWYKMGWSFAIDLTEAGFIAMAIIGFLLAYMKFVGD